MQPPRIHIIGAGLAGLSAAVSLAGTRAQIFLHEAARAAGGRCRTYHDPQLGMMIDNGNHLLLSGNHAALAYLRRIGAEDRLTSPSSGARFPFMDLRSGARWVLSPSSGRFPFWIFSKRRRAPGTSIRDHLDLLRLMRSGPDIELRERISCSGALFDNMLGPVMLSALNTDPARGSTHLARAIMRETLARGATYCGPLIARDGLSHALVDPALAYLEAHQVAVTFSDRLRTIEFGGDRVSAILFEDRRVGIGPSDMVVLATPPNVTAALLPGLTAPEEHNAIVNAHFAIAPPADLDPITGVIGGTTEWLFTYPDRLSTTTSAANALLETPREDLAKRIWDEVKQITGLDTEMPPWQIVREKRATFSATPHQNARRPQALTAFKNVFLAGDWTATGLPATIEGAIRSGETAAALARSYLDRNLVQAHRATDQTNTGIQTPIKLEES